MKALIAAVGLAFALASGAAHASWQNMNADINATNFIIELGASGQSGICTGTLISLKYRLVLTANHCLTENIAVEEKDETDDSGTVTKVKREVFTDLRLSQKSYQGFRNVGNTDYLAQIVAHKQVYDLGLLQIRADAIPQTVYSHVLPASEKVARGDQVFVVGNPLGFDASVSRGIISSTTRMMKVDWADGADVPFYQMDAATNPGNSGGALYNADGELIGLPDAGAHGYTGLGLAIPVDLIRKFLAENCYEDVWNDHADKTHAQCVASKLDAENKRREKAGMAPLKAIDPQSSEPDAPVLRTMDWRQCSGIAATLTGFGVPEDCQGVLR